MAKGNIMACPDNSMVEEFRTGKKYVVSHPNYFSPLV